jgi:hypothetical protein
MRRMRAAISSCGEDNRDLVVFVGRRQSSRLRGSSHRRRPVEGSTLSSRARVDGGAHQPDRIRPSRGVLKSRTLRSNYHRMEGPIPSGRVWVAWDASAGQSPALQGCLKIAHASLEPPPRWRARFHRASFVSPVVRVGRIESGPPIDLNQQWHSSA